MINMQKKRSHKSPERSAMASWLHIIRDLEGLFRRREVAEPGANAFVPSNSCDLHFHASITGHVFERGGCHASDGSFRTSEFSSEVWRAHSLCCELKYISLGLVGRSFGFGAPLCSGRVPASSGSVPRMCVRPESIYMGDVPMTNLCSK